MQSNTIEIKIIETSRFRLIPKGEYSCGKKKLRFGITFFITRSLYVALNSVHLKRLWCKGNTV